MIPRFPVAALVVLLAACGGSGGGDLGPSDVPDARDADVPVDGGDAPDAADLPDLDAPGDDGLPSDPGPDGATDILPDVPPDVPPSDPSFQRLHLADVGDIHALWSAADGSAWAVGAKGLVLRSDGDEFLPVLPQPPTTADLFGISGDTDTVFAVGAGGVVLRRMPSKGWEVLREADGTDLLGVAAASPTEAWAVGRGGRVLHFLDGTFTTEATGITSDLHGVSASSAGGVRVVGAYGTLLERGQTAWVRSQIAGPVTTLRSIWRAPDGRMAAVGSGGAVVLYDGLTWRLQVTNDPAEPGRDLHAVWGMASDDITAVGDKGVVIHYDGERWSVMTVAGPYNAQADLRGIAGRAGPQGTTIVAAAGLGSLALELREDAWYDRSLGVTADLRGVAVAPDGTLAIVGESGLVLRGAPDRLGATRLPVPGAFNGVSWPVAVGDGGALAVLSGPVPVLVPSGTEEDLTDVFADGAAAWVTGAKGTVFHLADGTLTAYASRPLPLRAVCSEGGRVWAAGDAGRVELDEGAGFRVLTTGTSSTIHDLLPLASGGVAAAGDNGLILECLPSGCRRAYEEPATFLYGLGGPAASPLAVGWAGTVLRRGIDGTWTALDPGTLRVFRAVAGDAAGTFEALVGPDGTLVLHRDSPEAAE